MLKGEQRSRKLSFNKRLSSLIEHHEPKNIERRSSTGNIATSLKKSFSKSSVKIKKSHTHDETMSSMSIGNSFSDKYILLNKLGRGAVCKIIIFYIYIIKIFYNIFIIINFIIIYSYSYSYYYAYCCYCYCFFIHKIIIL